MVNLVYVIIPTHNRVDLLTRAIDSLLAQSFKDLEQLPLNLQEHNRRLVLKEFSQKEIDFTYKNLISN